MPDLLGALRWACSRWQHCIYGMSRHASDLWSERNLSIGEQRADEEGAEVVGAMECGGHDEAWGAQ